MNTITLLALLGLLAAGLDCAGTFSRAPAPTVTADVSASAESVVNAAVALDAGAAVADDGGSVARGDSTGSDVPSDVAGRLGLSAHWRCYAPVRRGEVATANPELALPFRVIGLTQPHARDVAAAHGRYTAAEAAYTRALRHHAGRRYLAAATGFAGVAASLLQPSGAALHREFTDARWLVYQNMVQAFLDARRPTEARAALTTAASRDDEMAMDLRRFLDLVPARCE